MGEHVTLELSVLPDYLKNSKYFLRQQAIAGVYSKYLFQQLEEH